MADVRELDVEELARWGETDRSFTLLDVRRDDELEQAAVSGALHIPMHEVQRRIGEVPRDKPLVVMCHYGDRSWRVARFLLTDGFQEVYNLEGGIDAYSLRVDSSIPRY